MQSKVSSFNRGIIKQDLRSVGWIGIIYQIAMLFALPLQIIMMHGNERFTYFYYTNMHSLFEIGQEIQFFIMFIAPVALGTLLLRYMHTKGSADFIHSLPVKRSTLFNHHLFIGLLLLIIPVLITAITTTIVHNILNLDKFFTIADLTTWAGITILMNVFVFVLTFLLGTVTGISAVQVVLTYIFLLFPTGIIVIFYHNVQYFIFGFKHDYYFGQYIEYLSPIIRMLSYRQLDFSLKEVVIYILLTIVIYLLAVFVYKKRQIEGATQAISFRYLKPIFKYGVTFCAMLLSGSYFGEMQNEDFGWLLFGYFFGSILGYVIAEMILQKTWRVFRSLKSYVVYVVAIFALGFLLNLDITGYEKRVPAVAEIERAYFSESIHWFNKKNVEEISYIEPVDPYSKRTPIPSAIKQADLYYFDKEKTIADIIKVHKQFIQDKNEIHNNQDYYYTIGIGYELKDGSRIARQYEISEYAYAELLKPIYESQEFRYSKNELLRLKDGIDVDKIRISTHNYAEKNYGITDSAQIEEMVNALKTDMLKEPYEAMISYRREPWGEIELLLENNQRLYLPWKKSYTQFSEWIDANDLTAKTRIVPEDIEYAMVIRNENYKETPQTTWETSPTQSFDNGLKVVDETQLEECLYQLTWETNSQYLVALYTKRSSEPFIQGLVTPPTFVEQQIK